MSQRVIKTNPTTGSTSSGADDRPETPPTPPRPPPQQTALSQTLIGTANLANLLPTGTLLAFQLLSPIFTNNGTCDAVTRPMTALLLLILAASCFLACFTDSVKPTPDSPVYHGIATLKGMWLFDYDYARDGDPQLDLRKYKLRFIDVVHATLSVMVFGAVALRDGNVVRCFYPQPGHEAQEVLDIVPLGVGLLCSLLFVVFPTTRHGIGYPVTHAHKDVDS